MLLSGTGRDPIVSGYYASTVESAAQRTVGSESHHYTAVTPLSSARGRFTAQPVQNALSARPAEPEISPAPRAICRAAAEAELLSVADLHQGNVVGAVLLRLPDLQQERVLVTVVGDHIVVHSRYHPATRGARVNARAQ